MSKQRVPGEYQGWERETEECGANQKAPGRPGWSSSQFSEPRPAVGQGSGDSLQGVPSVNLRLSILLFILLLSILLRGRKYHLLQGFLVRSSIGFTICPLFPGQVLIQGRSGQYGF